VELHDLAENVALPLRLYTGLGEAEMRRHHGLQAGRSSASRLREYYPSELSGGMQEARRPCPGHALDPDILYFDEPSAGLDPLSARSSMS